MKGKLLTKKGGTKAQEIFCGGNFKRKSAKWKCKGFKKIFGVVNLLN